MKIMAILTSDLQMSSRKYFSYTQNSFTSLQAKAKIFLSQLLLLEKQRVKKSMLIKEISKTVIEQLGSEVFILLALIGIIK